MKPVMQLSEPVDFGERTVVPLILDMTMVSGHGGFVSRDPVGLVIMENKQAWFVSLAEGVTVSAIDELLGIK